MELAYEISNVYIRDDQYAECARCGEKHDGTTATTYLLDVTAVDGESFIVCKTCLRPYLEQRATASPPSLGKHSPQES